MCIFRMNNSLVTDGTMIDVNGLKVLRTKLKILRDLPLATIRNHLRAAQIEQKEADKALTLIQAKQAQLAAESEAATKRSLLTIQQVILIENLLTQTEERDEEQDGGQWCGTCQNGAQECTTYKPY